MCMTFDLAMATVLLDMDVCAVLSIKLRPIERRRLCSVPSQRANRHRSMVHVINDLPINHVYRWKELGVEVDFGDEFLNRERCQEILCVFRKRTARIKSSVAFPSKTTTEFSAHSACRRRITERNHGPDAKEWCSNVATVGSPSTSRKDNDVSSRSPIILSVIACSPLRL